MEFSKVARPALSWRTPSTTWPSRPSTCTDTLYPCALQASIVARAIVVAMASEMSLWPRSWAFAELTRPQASAETTETPAIRNAVLDMGMHLPGESRCSRGVLPIIGYCVGFASALAAESDRGCGQPQAAAGGGSCGRTLRISPQTVGMNGPSCPPHRAVHSSDSWVTAPHDIRTWLGHYRSAAHTHRGRHQTGGLRRSSRLQRDIGAYRAARAPCVHRP